MEIGLSTANYYPELDTEDIIELYQRNGITSVEIFLNTFYETEENYIRELKEKLDRYSMKCNSVHVMSAMMEPCLFDLHKRRRDDYLKIFRHNLKIIRLLNCSIYTFHGATEYSFENSPENHMVDCYRRIYNEAYENDIFLAQENVAYLASGKLSFYETLKEKMDIPMKFTLDIKQVRRVGGNYKKYIEVMGKDLCNLHLSDGDASHTCLNVGEGDFSFRDLFSELKKSGYEGRGILELYRNNFKNMEDLKKGINKLKEWK